MSILVVGCITINTSPPVQTITPTPIQTTATAPSTIDTQTITPTIETQTTQPTPTQTPVTPPQYCQTSGWISASYRINDDVLSVMGRVGGTTLSNTVTATIRNETEYIISKTSPVLGAGGGVSGDEAYGTFLIEFENNFQPGSYRITVASSCNARTYLPFETEGS